MPRLVPLFEPDYQGRMIFGGTFEAVEADGTVSAVGHLEVDALPGDHITQVRFVGSAPEAVAAPVAPVVR